MRIRIAHSLVKTRSLPFLLALLVPLIPALMGCAEPTASTAQGPTGAPLPSFSTERESYLIPPEIPSALLSFLFTTVEDKAEIVAIAALSSSEDRWVLAVTSEQLPKLSITKTQTFIRVGQEWREE